MGFGRDGKGQTAAGLDSSCSPSSTCLKRSKGRDRLGVPVKKIALQLRLTADTAASVCRASGGFSLVRSVWLSSAMMIFQPLDAKQCCITAVELGREGVRLKV